MALLLLHSRLQPTPRSTLFPYTTLFRSAVSSVESELRNGGLFSVRDPGRGARRNRAAGDSSGNQNDTFTASWPDRKSTRLNSSHRCISYAVFCLKKKIVTTTLSCDQRTS